MRNGIAALAGMLVVVVLLSSCSLITVDCGGPTTRSAVASAMMHADGDTMSVDGFVSAIEERRDDGVYIRELTLTLALTDAAHHDSVPTTLHAHITGARLELPSGAVLYHVGMHDNSSPHNVGALFAVAQSYDVPSTLFDDIRRHLPANDLTFVVETDQAIRFAPARVSLRSARDWRKTSACQ